MAPSSGSRDAMIHLILIILTGSRLAFISILPVFAVVVVTSLVFDVVDCIDDAELSATTLSFDDASFDVSNDADVDSFSFKMSSVTTVDKKNIFRMSYLKDVLT